MKDDLMRCMRCGEPLVLERTTRKTMEKVSLWTHCLMAMTIPKRNS